MSKRYLFTVLLVLVMVPALALAQGTISGSVTDGNTGDALPGANVIVDGQPYGGASDLSGAFAIEGVPAGNYTVTASVIGYESVTLSVQVANGVTTTLNYALSSQALEMSDIEVLASRADANTPVAYTNISKEEMEVRLGSQDIPLVLNTSPSVYATNQGGGAGDARINVRGFNQNNVAVMINGVPQNDMENGWVYWSNWDGVGDATSSIQMQRGLSAVNLATPSIGGTMNIITDPTKLDAGGSVKAEYGAGNFMKATVNYNTGLIADKFAFSSTIVRKTGDGLIDKNWTDAWAYYFGAAYSVSADNRFELYAIGAPQRHGQNLYKQNIMSYDQEFAGEVGDKAALEAADSDEDGKSDWEEWNSQFTNDAGEDAGRYFSQNWAPISSDYEGEQYWYMYGERNVERYSPDFLNERENFFHKPLINLNHYMNLTEKMRLSSVLYWSGGSGGGTGTYGKIPTLDADGTLGGEDYRFYFGSGPWTRDWNTLLDYNSGSDDTVYVDQSALVRTHGADNNQSVGILRNSINRQSTIGLISKLNFDMSDMLKLQVGIDWRTAGIEHAREVRDLMGGDYYLDFADDNAPNGKRVTLGDIIAYHNETTVDWIGGFVQGNYSAGALSGYGMGGFSSIKYSYQDHFTVADEVIESEAIGAMQVKGGGMFHLSDNLNIFGNFGFVEKPPIMDNVIYIDGTVASDPTNETFVSSEVGVNFKAKMFAVTANVYNTAWNDRNLTKSVTTGQGSSGDTDVIFLTGVNQTHKGLEIEASVQPMKMLRLDASLSFGDWQFTDDASGRYVYDMYDSTGVVSGQGSLDYDYALKDLKIGDMPQTAYVVGATITPIKGLRLQALYSIYDNNYSDWDPDSREYDGDDANADREQVWMAPGYGKMDVHLAYDLPKIAGMRAQLFAHVFNALDDVYVQDAVDHSQYNGFKIKDADGNTINNHSVQRAEVFLGSPRFFNAGVKFNF
jgi:outer membrane cobalamin receptor